MHFKVDMNNIRQRQNNVLIFNVKFHNVVKMTISNKSNSKNISNRIRGIQSFNFYFITFFSLLPMLRRICLGVLAKPRKFLKDEKNTALQELNLKELRNYILCIIRVWSLFCLALVYKSLHFLPTRLVKLGFHLSVF